MAPTPRFSSYPRSAAVAIWIVAIPPQALENPLPFEGYALEVLADTMNHDLAALGRRLVLILYSTTPLIGIGIYGNALY